MHRSCQKTRNCLWSLLEAGSGTSSLRRLVMLLVGHGTRLTLDCRKLHEHLLCVMLTRVPSPETSVQVGFRDRSSGHSKSKELPKIACTIRSSILTLEVRFLATLFELGKAGRSFRCSKFPKGKLQSAGRIQSFRRGKKRRLLQPKWHLDIEPIKSAPYSGHQNSWKRDQSYHLPVRCTTFPLTTG